MLKLIISQSLEIMIVCLYLFQIQECLQLLKEEYMLWLLLLLFCCLRLQQLLLGFTIATGDLHKQVEMASITYSWFDKIRFVPINLSTICLIEFVVVETGIIRLHSYNEVRYYYLCTVFLSAKNLWIYSTYWFLWDLQKSQL